MEKSIYTKEQAALCDLLRQIRLGSGLRQEELAERLGRPQSFVSRYESGQQQLDILELRQICVATGVALADFVLRLENSLRET